MSAWAVDDVRRFRGDDLRGFRGDRVRTVGLSFGVSLGVHALLAVMVMLAFSRAAIRAPLVVQRVRLVYVDPAPAAAPLRGVDDGATTVAPAAPLPAAPVVPPKPPAKPVLSEKKVAQPKPVAPVAAPRPVDPPAEAVTAPPADALAREASGVSGAQGDTVGGTADGQGGGRVGGTGSDVLRLGDVATAPVLVTRVVPEYPRRARLAGIEGEVVLEVVVDAQGRVRREIRTVAAVPELARAAIEAVQRWRFKPARDRQGTAVAVMMEIPVRFVLHEATADAR